MLWHVVLISFRPDAPQSAKDETWKRYQTLDVDCGGYDAGILYWKVGYNRDLRIKDVGKLVGSRIDLIEISIFMNNDALQTFRTHPKHKKLTRILTEIADWMVGDTEFTVNNDGVSLWKVWDRIRRLG